MVSLHDRQGCGGSINVSGQYSGDPVYFRHAKAGEPAEHLSAVAVYCRDRDAIVDVWPTYRGEGKVFL